MPPSRSARQRRPRRKAPPVEPAYDRSVFINCPFDGAYKPLFHALIFTVSDCGLFPRCALQVYDSGRVRIDKVFALIERCRFGIHDISRTELDPATHLPRFNMPLELGIFLGARRFGSAVQRHKNCLIFDRERYRFQQFISDLAGHDIAAHGNDAAVLIGTVRDWLGTASGGMPRPGGAAIAQRFAAFCADLPADCARLHLSVDALTFTDYAHMVHGWLTEQSGRQ